MSRLDKITRTGIKVTSNAGVKALSDARICATVHGRGGDQSVLSAPTTRRMVTAILLAGSLAFLSVLGLGSSSAGAAPEGSLCVTASVLVRSQIAVASNEGVGACGVPRGPITHRFSSCQAFVKYLRKPRILAKTYFWIHVSFGDRVGPPQYPQVGWLNGYGAITQVVMPEFVWPHMTRRQRTEVATLLGKLRVHEDGHVRIADEYARGIPLFFMPAPTTTARIVQLGSEQTKLLQKREDEYDALTAHGVHQSRGPSGGFPGGEDVVFPYDGCRR